MIYPILTILHWQTIVLPAAMVTAVNHHQNAAASFDSTSCGSRVHACMILESQ
jgi:hypothetical protein